MFIASEWFCWKLLPERKQWMGPLSLLKVSLRPL
uniref:Uncharacterized protein n=1 Tax=Arundo donax TaxID=35708 RepID=A0A0A8YHW8_ARUDO